MNAEITLMVVHRTVLTHPVHIIVAAILDILLHLMDTHVKVECMQYYCYEIIQVGCVIIIRCQ